VHCIRGYRGRTGIFETLMMTKEMRKIILKSKDFIDEEALRALAMQNGIQTLRKSAIELVKQGLTSLETVEGMLVEE
jgi:type IV pilus assembly protein PilB